MRSYKLHFIRHGITEGNKQGVYVGRSDVSVTEEGIQMIKMLDEKMDYPYVERIYTSPLLRCRQTADIIYPDREKIIVEGLTEIDFGEFEGRSYEELKNDKRFVNWIANSAENDLPFGESASDFLNRTTQALNDIFNNMMTEGIFDAAVFTHGGVIMNLFAALGLPQRQMSEWVTENGKGYTVLMTPQMWTRDGVFEIYDIVPKPRRDEED